MKYGEFIDTIYEVLSEQEYVIPRTDIKMIVDMTFDVIKDNLDNDDDLTITGFGKFFSKQADERIGRNPITGKSLKIPARKVPKFKYSKKFRDEIA